MRVPVYLDNHATTRTDPRVVDRMLPYFDESYGNASSRQHAYGWKAEAAVELARKQVARLAGADPAEVIFTSGATESINLAIKGVAEAAGWRGHVITTAIEHHAVLDSCRWLEGLGLSVTVLPLDASGCVKAGDLESSIRPDTFLVSVMTANNEIGTLQPVEEIGALCAARGIFFHTDAVQAAGKLPLAPAAVQAGALSLSAHKMYGPKGVGALVVRGGATPRRVRPILHGGGQERGIRPGTLNVPGIVGFGAAAEIALDEMEEEARRTADLRDRLVALIRQELPETRLNGDPERRLPGNASLTFPGATADRVIAELRDVALSTGSACASGTPGPSHVLTAIGLDRAAAGSTLRVGVGRYTTVEEIEYAARRIAETVARVRGRIPVTEQERDSA